MTIQISVTVWTVLCFLALMLILDRLLFRPLLSFMDKRREKIENAKLARKTALQEREEELSRREEALSAAKVRAMQDASAALEDVRRENAERIAGKKAENARRLETLREELGTESREILAAVEPRTDELVSAIADRIRIRGGREDA